MKVIFINESQKKRLFEAYDGEFSFSELDRLNLNGMYDYCLKHLGEPCGSGSSRLVFMLSDNIVLKLAFGIKKEAGMAQNRIEYERYEETKSKLLPVVYDHSDNFEYIVCEHVIPADNADFEKILGMSIWGRWGQHTIKRKNLFSRNGGDMEVGYDKYFDNLKDYREADFSNNYVLNLIAYIVQHYADGTCPYNEEMEQKIRNNEWFSELLDLVRKTHLCDITSTENFGIVNRNGIPMIVVIDSGLSNDVYNKYYK